MGFRGMSFGSLLLIFLIILLLFGGKRIKEMAADLGMALRNFRKSLQEEEVNKKEE